MQPLLVSTSPSCRRRATDAVMDSPASATVPVGSVTAQVQETSLKVVRHTPAGMSLPASQTPSTMNGGSPDGPRPSGYWPGASGSVEGAAALATTVSVIVTVGLGAGVPEQPTRHSGTTAQMIATRRTLQLPFVLRGYQTSRCSDSIVLRSTIGLHVRCRPAATRGIDLDVTPTGGGLTANLASLGECRAVGTRSSARCRGCWPMHGLAGRADVA